MHNVGVRTVIVTPSLVLVCLILLLLVLVHLQIWRQKGQLLSLVVRVVLDLVL